MKEEEIEHDAWGSKSEPKEEEFDHDAWGVKWEAQEAAADEQDPQRDASGVKWEAREEEPEYAAWGLEWDNEAQYPKRDAYGWKWEPEVEETDRDAWAAHPRSNIEPCSSGFAEARHEDRNSSVKSSASHQGVKRRPPATPRDRTCAGMSFEGLHPKTAVANFLRRYCGRNIDEDDCCYKCCMRGRGFVATLAAPCFNNKTYVGLESPTEKGAETSAAAKFLQDLDVVHAAANLAVSMRSIKRQMKSDPAVAKRLKQQGRLSQVSHETYNRQAEDGRRNAVWDGRA